MSLVDEIARAAPFLAANWPYVLGASLTTIILAVVISFFATKPNSPKRQSKTITSFDKGEHPLSEFDKEVSDETMTPSLHSPDTLDIPYSPGRLTEKEMIARSKSFYELLNKRRSVRMFSQDAVPLEVIENIVWSAGTSPSGAHCEPWTFVVVQDPKVKAQIRDIIEQEEYLNYDHRMGDKWVADLKFIKTNHEKVYLEDAPYLIIVMKQQYHLGENGIRHAHYYYEISTAIAAGVLITAIHNAGLVTVTTTPLNAGGALREVLGRPQNEKVMLLLPVGYPADHAKVPGIARKPLKDIMALK